MIVYSFDPTSMEFVGVTDAFESPLEPGVFLLPANSTEVAPPDFDNVTQFCAFNGTDWTLTDRPLPEPDPVPTPEEIHAVKVSALLNERVQLLYSSDWMIIRHQDELLAGATPTLTATKLKAVLDYRQALRDLPKADGFPECSLPVLMWPTSP
jgi:hypothetical protein